MNVKRHLFAGNALKASRYFDQLRADMGTEASIDWAKESPENVDELMKVAVVSELARQSPLLGSIDRETLFSEAREYRAGRRRVIRWVAGVAVCVLTSVLIGIGYFLQGAHKSDADWASYSTIGGAAVHVALAEGSSIDLAPQTALRVHVTKTERDVELASGQATFDVKHLDPVVPFIVRANVFSVQVKGTRFVVTAQPDNSSVEVLEGSVDVRSHKPGVQAILLASGERVSVRNDGEFADLPGDPNAPPLASPADAPDRNNFNATPLSEVASVFNRANKTPRFVVLGAARAQPFTGTVKIDEPERLEQILRRRGELNVQRRGDEVVVTMKGGN